MSENNFNLTLDPFGDKAAAAAEAIADAPTAPTLTGEQKAVAEDYVKQAESGLTEEELSAVNEFAEKIDITDTTAVLQYGAGTQKKMADFSDAALQNVRTQDLGEVGALIADVVGELSGFDAEEERGFLGFFKKQADKLETMKNRYAKAEVNVAKISDALEGHQVQLLKDVESLDKMYDLNLSYFKEISMYILAGKEKLEIARATELEELKQKALASGLPEDAQLVSDYENMLERFEKKISDLELSRMIALQTAPQIRLIHRITENATILYDGDSAGIKAALRGIDMMLEEGINVKVVLLPEGEDPDSFARKHNATEVLEYIQQHQTDFIRLKTQLLSADAGNDPVKRADMITQIVQSIAIIPDIIKRQIYTKDCSVSLGIQEDVLTRKVVELRKKYVDEQRKKKSAPEKNTEVEEISVAEPTVAVEPQQPTAKITIKEQNIQNLMQLIVRYGEVVIYQSENQIVRAGEYIISELHRDNVDVDNALYQLIMEEYMAHYKEPNWVAATYFQYHPNGDISQLAVNMLADKYQLSRMYAKQMVSENVVKEVDMPSDVDMLPDMVQRMLLELKYTIVNERIDTMQTMLKEAQIRDDWELIRTILEQQPVLIDIRQQLCKALGNRVILH